MEQTAEDFQQRMRLYASREADEEIYNVFLIQQGDTLALWRASAPDDVVPLPQNVLPAIFARYGKPLEAELDLAPLLQSAEDDGPLHIPLEPVAGKDPPAPRRAMLQRFRFMPFGWVHPADYLLWTPPAPEEALAAPAPLIVSALEALGRALMRKA